MFMHFFERLVEVLRHLDVLKHAGQLVDVVGWHSYFLLGHMTSQVDSLYRCFLAILHVSDAHFFSLLLRSYPEPLHHVLLYLAVC